MEKPGGRQHQAEFDLSIAIKLKSRNTDPYRRRETMHDVASTCGSRHFTF
jgi:hypothetical protein